MWMIFNVVVAAALLLAPAANVQESGPSTEDAGDERFDAEHYHPGDLEHIRYTVYPGMKP